MTSSKGRLQVLRNIVWYSSEKALRMTIGLFVGLWLARYLGPEEFGRFNFITAWLGMFEAIAWLGVGDTMLRDIVRHRDEEHRMMGSALMIRMCGSLLAISLALAAAKPLGGFNEADFILLAVLSIGIPFAQVTGGIWIWFASHTNIGPAVLSKNISMLIGAVLRISVILAGADLVALMAAVSLESVLWLILLVGAYLWHGEHFSRWRFDTRHAWGMLLTGMPIILNGLVVSLNARVDQIMLGRLTSMSDVGVYAAAMRFSEIWWVVPPMILQSLASRYIYPEDLGYKLQQNVARIILGMAFLSLLPCLFISVMGAEVINLFLGKQYLGAGHVLMIHIWTAVLIFIDAPVNQYLLATHRQSQLVFKSLVLLFSNVVMALILVPQYGASGAAMSTLIAQAATVLVLPMLYSPLHDVSGMYLLAIRQVQPLSISVYNSVMKQIKPIFLSFSGLLAIDIQKWRDKFVRILPGYFAADSAGSGGLAMVLSVGFCAAILGYLASTADPVKIGLGASLMLGSALLYLPEFSIWLILVMGFLFGVISANALFSKLTWGVSLLSMLLFVPALSNMLWRQQRRAPVFMLLALVFLAYAVGISVFQCYSLIEFVAGFKRCFQSFGLMLALTMIGFLPHNFTRWLKFLMVVALLQFPFALYELLVLVPQRGGLNISSATTDVIAGTFGANLEGGSPNSVMVVYLFIALAFLIARWKAGVIKSRVFYPMALICLLPLGMGETKIALIMLPLIGLILIKEDLLRAPLRFLPGFIALTLLTAMLGYLYITVMMQSTLEDVINQTVRYNFGDQSYTGKAGDLNRWTAITFWFQEQGWHDPVSFLFGNGLGSAFTADNPDNMSSGHMGFKYSPILIDLTGASTLLWDTGLIGVLLFVSIFLAAWTAAGNLRRSVSDPVVKADALAIQAAIALFLLSLVYAIEIVTLISMELIYSIVLGYLGYLMNQHEQYRQRYSSTFSLPQYV
jgi:O-antigen/teichoic acid export membrane protein